MWCDEEQRAIAALQRHLMWVARHRAVRDRAQAVGGRIAAGQNREYAWRVDRRCDVDPGDPGVRVRRAQDVRVGLPRQAEIVRLPASAHQQTRILAPRNRFADALWRKLLAGIQKRH